MDWRKILLAASIGVLSTCSAMPTPHPTIAIDGRSQLSQRQVKDLAAKITVKVLSGEFLGSGILIHRRGDVYAVLTNAHVLRSSTSPYRIQTPDGRVYQGKAADKSRLPYPNNESERRKINIKKNNRKK